MPRKHSYGWVLVHSALAGVVPSPGAQVLCIAHRGGALYAPENTIAAFTNSLAVTDLMETDAQITNFINLGVDGIVCDDPWAVRGVPPPSVMTTHPPRAPTFLGDRLIAYWKIMVDDFALWKRALTQTEIQNIFNGGQLGQSLGDLLIQPTSLLTITSIKQTAPGVRLEINFQNQGPWSSFQLRRATNIAGPYFPIPDLVPVVLGGGNYRYDYSPTHLTGEFFRIEGF